MNNIHLKHLIFNKLIDVRSLRSRTSLCCEYRTFHLTYNKKLHLINPLYQQSTNIIKAFLNKSNFFCTASDKETRHKVKDELKAYLRHNKEKLRNTEQKIKNKGNVLLKDIKETTGKVKEKVEGIIERENIYTIPNMLCVSRIVLAPYLGYLIVQGNFDLALIILGVAGGTDLLDGWIARTWKNQASKMGSFLDPMADKILVATLFLTLTYADLIPLGLTAMIVARDVCLVTAGFVIRYKSLPPPRTLSRYFDATHATAQLIPTFISRVNTAVQLLLVGSTLAAPVFHYVGHPILEGLCFIAGATTIASGFSYLTSKNTYKFLKTGAPKK